MRKVEVRLSDVAGLEAVEALVAELRADPARFRHARSVGAGSALGTARTTVLIRRHYHTTPDELLRRARLEAAKRHLLVSEASLSAVARLVGYANHAALHNDFQTHHGLTPAAYRRLRTDTKFSIQLPEGYPSAYLRRALGRDPHGVTERLDGRIYTAAIRLGEDAHVLKMILAPTRVAVSVEPATSHLPRVHALVVGLLGLGQPASAFARLARRLKLTRLVAGRPGLCISQTPTIFDGLLWTIIGQQINFPFACLLRRRLVEKAGTPLPGRLFAPPPPRAVAALDPGELLPLQFSRQKASYLVSVARLVADETLDLKALRSMSATRAEQTLHAIRGLGPWSVNYLLMRSLGFADCLPLGDTGVTSGLRSLFRLRKRPDLEATRRLMARFSPFRSLATAHLWQLDRPHPDEG